MTDYPILTQPQLSQEAIRVLMRELGPVNALRFVAHLHPQADGKDAVQRHREFAVSVENNPGLLEEIIREIEQEDKDFAAGDTDPQRDDRNS